MVSFSEQSENPLILQIPSTTCEEEFRPQQISRRCEEFEALEGGGEGGGRKKINHTFHSNGNREILQTRRNKGCLSNYPYLKYLESYYSLSNALIWLHLCLNIRERKRTVNTQIDGDG